MLSKDHLGASPRELLIVLAVVGASVLGLAGCGPITATTTIAKATVAVEGAAGAQAEQFALYEYTSAQEFLLKAREEEGFSDFQAAIDYANRAREFAEKAKNRAMTNPKRGLPAMRPAPVPVAPVPVAPIPAPAPTTRDLPSGSSL